MVSLVSAFLSAQSIECLNLYDDQAAGGGGDHPSLGLGALEWDRIRYSFHASRKLWDKCAMDMLMLALRIEVQDPDASCLLLNVELACLNSLRLCPEHRRFLITKPMRQQDVSGEASQLEVITLRCLHFRIAATEARVKLGHGQYLSTIASSWSDEVAAARMCEDLVKSLVFEGYFDCAITLVVSQTLYLSNILCFDIYIIVSYKI